MKLPNQQTGFTLIELMVVVGIIAILASIALPSYDRYLVKSRRAAGSSCLLEMAQFAERYHTTNMSYAGAVLPTTACRTELAPHYAFSFSVQTANSFTLQAVPQGAQASKDTECGTLSVTHTGTRTSSGGGNCF